MVTGTLPTSMAAVRSTKSSTLLPLKKWTVRQFFRTPEDTRTLTAQYTSCKNRARVNTLKDHVNP
jgi:hypothetical protein